MLDPQPLYEQIGPFLMVLFRLSGLFLFAPLLSSSIIPTAARVLLVCIFTFALYPTLPHAQRVPIHLDIFSLAPAVFCETLIGLAIGLLASLPMFAAQLGGQIMGQQAGFSLGQVYNPSLDTDADLFGQLMQYIAMFAFVAAGGLEVLFLALANTFSRVPVATPTSGLAPLDLILGVTGSGFDLALRVSAPVLCIIFIETLASSILMKTIPQINTQSIGFATKIIVSFLALIAGIAAIAQAVNDDVLHTNSQIVKWSLNLVDPPPTQPHAPSAPFNGGR